MGQEIVWVLKTLILPPGGIILLGLLGLILSRRFLGKFLLVLSLAALYMLSTPFLANQLMAGVETIPALTAEEATNSGAQAIVLLSGGRYSDAPEYGADTISERMLMRVRYAAWLARRSRLPIIISGGSPEDGGLPEAELARRVLEQEFGVKVAAIETNSRTTWDNAYMTREILQKMGIQRVLLVSHAMHMPRAIAVFDRAGVDVMAAPTRFFHKQDDEEELSDWLPSPFALVTSYYALHEYLGRLWYRIRR